jgi:hypothetical protein
MFPVEVCYVKEPVADYCQAVVDTVFGIHLRVSWAYRRLAVPVHRQLTVRNPQAMSWSF